MVLRSGRPQLRGLLALALGGGAAASAGAQERPFRLQLFPEELARSRGARCLDRSAAGYYLRAQDPGRWVVFLEGGGLCFEVADCLYRAAKTARGSSRFWKPDATPENNHMLTSTSALNPFANWSHVYVPYCSGDTWLGNSKAGHALLLGLQMSGHLILETLMEQLGNTTAIGKATDVVLGGTSAGGIGTFHHIDWFADRVRGLAAAAGAPPPRVTGFPVEGIFFPRKFPVLFPEFVLGVRSTVGSLVARWVTNLFKPIWMHPACTAAARSEGFDAHSCFDISLMFKFIRTPVFAVTNLFDALLIEDLGVCLGCSAQSAPASPTGRYVRYFGDLMEETVKGMQRTNPQFGFFATSEYHHDENFVDIFTVREKRIRGVSLHSAISAWYWDKAAAALLEPRCGEDLGPCADSGAAVGPARAPAAAPGGFYT